jgi:hypothetical protein
LTSYDFSNDQKDKIIAEKAQIIRYLQKEIELKNSGMNTLILPHDSAALIQDIVSKNNELQRPSVFILKHNGHSVTSVDVLL